MTTLLASAAALGQLVGLELAHLAGCTGAAPPPAGVAFGAEAAEHHVEDRAVHRAAHDDGEDGAARADERAGDDEQVVAEHEARGGRRPARVAVEQRHHHGHVRAADGHDEVHAEQPSAARHREQPRQPRPSPATAVQEGHREPHDRERTSALSRCRPGSSSGLPESVPRSLPHATIEPVNVTRRRRRRSTARRGARRARRRQRRLRVHHARREVRREPTSTAARPTKLCSMATSSGMPVISTRCASTPPTPRPPSTRARASRSGPSPRARAEP
jgi:hypothetical protein